jgi:4-hydroxy-tetrahydrodipicolinate reductase
VKIAVAGAAGRMGQAIIRLLAEEQLTLVGAIEHGKSPSLGKDAGELAAAGILGVEISADVSAGLLGAECVVEFTSAAAVPQLARAAAEKRVAIVSGTTALDARAESALDEAAKLVPVLSQPNMSLGVEVLASLVRQAIRALGPGYDVEIVETHHRKKVDAPSGTAKRLVEAVREARGEVRMLAGREGMPGARTDDEVGVLAVRGGDVIGDHTVHILGHGERIELTHRATSRELFARGALRAAKAIAKQKPGRYTMADVVRG